MQKIRSLVPIGMPIAIIIVLILAFISGPLINATTTEEQLATNVLLNAIPFLLFFVAILLTFITFIIVVARLLDGKVSKRTYSIIEKVIIAGILLGIIGMFQPWVFEFYKYGFLLLLVSTLSFIVWSHVQPKTELRQEDIGSMPVSEVESS
jgi:hypothetical protein